MSTEHPPTAPSSSEVIQILATEHWSLLATRALTYQETLGRVNMFLGILSGAVIALALVAQADHFGTAFISIAIFMLTVVAVVGLFTVSRLISLNRDDFHWVMAMNRVRNAYLGMHPELEQHFFTSAHDDLLGVMQSMGIEPVGPRRSDLVYGLTTLPGTVSVIVAAVAGTIAGLVAAGFGAPPLAIALLGMTGFVLALAPLVTWQRRDIRRGSAFAPSFRQKGGGLRSGSTDQKFRGGHRQLGAVANSDRFAAIPHETLPHSSYGPVSGLPMDYQCIGSQDCCELGSRRGDVLDWPECLTVLTRASTVRDRRELAYRCQAIRSALAIATGCRDLAYGLGRTY